MSEPTGAEQRPPEPTTDYGRKVDLLARQMARENPNAAKDLARRLLWYVREAQRLTPASIGLTLNFVTGNLEIRTGDDHGDNRQG